MATLDRNIAKIVAVAPEVQAALAAAATRVAAKARSHAAAHNDSGEYAGSIGTSKGRVDHYVQSSDPDAVSKEFGRTGALGRGKSHGVFALTRAMGDARGSA